jgi:hypothetical protein
MKQWEETIQKARGLYTNMAKDLHSTFKGYLECNQCGHRIDLWLSEWFLPIASYPTPYS